MRRLPDAVFCRVGCVFSPFSGFLRAYLVWLCCSVPDPYKVIQRTLSSSPAQLLAQKISP